MLNKKLIGLIIALALVLVLVLDASAHTGVVELLPYKVYVPMASNGAPAAAPMPVGTLVPIDGFIPRK